MAGKKKSPYDEFLLAAYDQLGDTSITHGVSMGFSILPSERRGVFRIVLRAMVKDEGERPRQIAKYEVLYPNASVESLPAQLYQATVKIEHMVAQYIGDAIAQLAQAGEPA